VKAVRVRKPEGFEGIDGLVYEDAPDPQPSIGDALVQVRAASFTPTELTWPLRTDRNGHDRVQPIPAHEGSGVVVALGYGAAGVSVGEEVYGLIDGYRDGWAAEYVVIEARSLAPKPATVDFIEAAAIPQAALTSWQALFDHGHLESGQTVVIHGAAGGVGSMAVQLARWAGAHVIGTGRAGSRQRVLELGADEFADLELDGWETAVGRADLVYDCIGGDVLARSPAIVKPGGALVTIMNPVQTDRDDISVVHFVRDPSGAQLREITRLVDQGILRPEVGAVYPLADTREAFMAKSAQHIPGKVVLTP
jgi:NADPH:quinone reductase-like Zn-dependent oxidoreductase